MKKIIIFLTLSSSLLTNLFAQLPDRKPGEWYLTTGFELIFSGGKVKNDSIGSINPHNVVRFSAFLDLAWNINYDFNRVLGFYTGWDVRNVGFINDFNVPGFGDVTVKQRSYDLGIPLALKLGNLTKDSYLAIGTEGEWMFAYKQKVIWNGSKNINSVWGSGKANAINPSVFAELHNQHGGYIRFKYYLYDFLKKQNMDFYIPTTNQLVSYQPASSKLFYISIGTAIRNKRLRNRHADKNDV
jgi:hypothetical protein